MSSDEDEELAALRAQRTARMGAAGMTRTALRQRLDDGIDEPSLRNGGSRAGGVSGGGDEDEDGPVVVMEEEADVGNRMDDPLRQHFPMAFGGQAVTTGNVAQLHARTARTGPAVVAVAVGSSDGGKAGGGEAVGPPLPSAAQGDENNEADLGPPRPPAGGDDDDDDEDGFVGPRPPGQGGGVAESEGEEEEEDLDPYNLPISHEVELKGFERMVSALDVDNAGSRVAAGGHDYMVRLYDFGGMKSDAKPFREFEPADGHPVLALSWSPSGDNLLVVTGSSQAKIFSRDGIEQGEFIRGDMYIRDMKNTKGHVSGLTGGQWHPRDRWTAMTCSEDGTLRVWDTHNILQTTVIKPTPSKPGRPRPTSCCYGGGGTLIGAGLQDGTLQLWDVRGKFGKSAAVGQVLPPKAQMHEQNKWNYVSGSKQVVRGAHESGEDVSGLAISDDGLTMASRAGDGTLKLWDLRSFKSPMHSLDGLPNSLTNTNVAFSPDCQLVLTGTTCGRDGSGGAIVFVDRAKGQIVRRLAVPGSSVVQVQWNARINQVFAATGERKSGCPRVLYDPRFSERGALLSVGRKPRVKDELDFQAPLVIHNPHALPMFRDNAIRKRRRDEADGAKAAAKPGAEAGKNIAGIGRGGKIGKTGGTILTQYLLKTHGLLHNPEEEDIRAAMLRHGDEGKGEEGQGGGSKPDKGFSQHLAAYAKTQPNKIFSRSDDEEEDEDGGGG